MTDPDTPSKLRALYADVWREVRIAAAEAPRLYFAPLMWLYRLVAKEQR